MFGFRSQGAMMPCDYSIMAEGRAPARLTRPQGIEKTFAAPPGAKTMIQFGTSIMERTPTASPNPSVRRLDL